MNRKYKVNDLFFEKIDCEEKAYALGLIISDGCLSKTASSYYVRFGQSEERKDLVSKLKNILNSDAKINSELRGSKLFYSIQICSEKMFHDLSLLGVTQAKSLSIRFPIIEDKSILPHFIRGLFDGDGCIWNGKRKKMIVKDKSTPTGHRDRIVHNVKFTYTGNDLFVSELQNRLVEEINLKKTILNYSKAKSKNNNVNEHVCTMEYSGRGNIKKLYDYMYRNATIFCEEKKEKFEKILCALDEKSSSETELIAGNPLEP